MFIYAYNVLLFASLFFQDRMKLRLYLACVYCMNIFVCLLEMYDTTSPNGCSLAYEDLSGYSSNGDLILGGLFAVHLDVHYPKVTFQEKPPPIQCTT